MKINQNKIIKQILIIFFIFSISIGCAVKKKHKTIPCPHFSLEILK